MDTRGEMDIQTFSRFYEAAQTDRELKEERKINSYRAQVVSILKQFDEEIREKETVKERCEVLYRFFEKLMIPKKLEKRRTEFDESGQVEKAREEEQVWNGVIQLLDEFVEMIGDEKFRFQCLQNTFEAGLNALQFSHVPPKIDHVIVGTIDHSRIASKKCAFLLGVNEGAWPMKPPVDGMINEQEREFLKQLGMELAESSRRVLLNDHFYMYLAFTVQQIILWVSYVLSDNEGNSKIAAPID